MDVKAYIASGILELYVTEALAPAEAREVEALAAQYPEIQNEIHSIQEAFNQYAILHSEEPRLGLKQEILHKVQPKPAQNVIKPGPNYIGRNWLSIAALLIAAVASVMAILCYNHSKGLEQQLNQALSENETLRRTSNTVVAQLDFIKNPNTRAIPLEDAAIVYWNQAQGSTLLAIKNLPAPPPGKQYQLWTITGNQAPQSAGLIEYDPTRLQEMFQVNTANAFAISLENEGGSDVPTDVKVLVPIG